MNGRALVADLHRVRAGWAGWAGLVKARRGAGVWRLADALLRQPVIDAQRVADELSVTRETRCAPSGRSSMPGS
jgi:hypothetical protein